MIYDASIASKYRKQAVTNWSDLEEGGIYFYFGGSKPSKVRVVSANEATLDLKPTSWKDTGWIVLLFVDESDSFVFPWSTLDMNIGAAYNPWMLFKDEAVAHAYADEIVITYGRDYEDDYYEDE